ncbi:MAG: glycosyl hydrolase [Coriobacteriia bacterium]|nr:glycosyl hydrolase [Coriobacteriia bacterium]
MKKLSFLLVIALAVFAFTATPAFAVKFRVSASANQSEMHKVVFTAKSSKRASVKITIFRGGHKLRKIGAHRSGKTYKANWTGSSVAAGTYAYTVTAVSSGSRKVTRGTVLVTSAPVTIGNRWIGLYVPGSPQDLAPLQAAESLTGTRTAVVNFFVSDSESFPAPRCQNVAGHGSIPMVTLEFWSIGSSGLSAITNGSKDAYIKKFADDAKSYGGTVYLRPFHEMNGDWYPWGGTVGSNSASKLVAAWQHVHDIFAAESATNVKFVWCVNNDNCPNTSANSVAGYWPGDAYVDYATLDGYNAGTTQSWSSWRPFADVFASSYKTVAALTAKPMFIAETSSVEQGGSKAAWIHDMFAAIPSKFPRLTGVCWFDANQTYDWRLDSSAASAAAFKAAVAAQY